ncbi:MAG TPA: carbohydrate kinase family protein [Chloroflexi bacterium]|nr:MAG: hypothetical protein DRI46_05415 [Chloroflexota bacterium]HDD54886.1 carbohydrate kinase family protein [Chloroflexota bacterium]
MVPEQPPPRDIFVGDLRRDFILTSADEWFLDAPGGSLLYASAGYLIWESEPGPGIMTRVGEDYPQAWLEEFAARGIDVGGVVVLPRSMDLRSFTFLEGQRACCDKNPLTYLSQCDVALPPGLIGYSNHWPPKSSRRDRSEISIREADIPVAYQSASGAHICPLDFLSHNLLPATLRGQGFTTITLDPSSSYMTPDFFGDFPSLIPGLTAIFPSEEDLRSLYKGKSVDLWEIAADLGHYGCELVVIKRGARGQYLYESATERKWEIPAYPARVVNPVGVGDAFCGGFLAAYRRSFDPLEAVFHGSVSASLTLEGNGAFFGLDALPGLAEARLEVLRDQAREV